VSDINTKVNAQWAVVVDGDDDFDGYSSPKDSSFGVYESKENSACSYTSGKEEEEEEEAAGVKRERHATVLSVKRVI